MQKNRYPLLLILGILLCPFFGCLSKEETLYKEINRVQAQIKANTRSITALQDSVYATQQSGSMPMAFDYANKVDSLNRVNQMLLDSAYLLTQRLEELINK